VVTCEPAARGRHGHLTFTVPFVRHVGDVQVRHVSDRAGVDACWSCILYRFSSFHPLTASCLAMLFTLFKMRSRLQLIRLDFPRRQRAVCWPPGSRGCTSSSATTLRSWRAFRRCDDLCPPAAFGPIAWLSR